MNNSNKISKIIPAILWSGIIFFLCFLPGSALPKEDWLDKIYFDKIVHAVLYFVLFLLILRIFNAKNTGAFSTASALCISQGILIEFVQSSSLIQHRSFDVWDIAANVFGVILAIFFTKHYLLSS
ncbi:MAG: VanZ family protein [Sphingobacteriales bacterium]|nr:VanZ family protein [Sphingobacteriales bacterium]